MNTMMQLQLLLGAGAAPEGGLARKSTETADVSFQTILGEQRAAQVTVQELAALGNQLQGPDREALNDLLVRLEGSPRERETDDVLAQLAGDGQSERLPAELALLSNLQNQMAWQNSVRQQPGQPAADGKPLTDGTPVANGKPVADGTTIADGQVIADTGDEGRPLTVTPGPSLPLSDGQAAVIDAAEMAGNTFSPTVQTAGEAVRMSAVAETVRPAAQRITDNSTTGQLSSGISPVSDADINELGVNTRSTDNRPPQELRFQAPGIQQQPAAPVTDNRVEATPPAATSLFDDQLGALNGTARQSPQAGEPASMTAPRQDFTQAALQARLGTPQWGPELGRQMATLVQRGDQRVSLHLNPQELGPLSVDIRVHEQQAQLQLMSSHAQVRSAVEQALPQLREALAEQGINLGEASVSDQQAQSREGQRDGGSAFAQTGETVQSMDGEADTDTVATVTEDGSGINLYV